MTGYSLDTYCRMIVDETRATPYRRALEATIREGDVVFDIGAGPGHMSLLACELGAARVYAIEPDAAIRMLQGEAQVRGVADRIIEVRSMSTVFDPPEKANVIVMDLRGIVPVQPGNMSSAFDARQRLLAPGGTLIPQRDFLFAAVVESPLDYQQLVDPWLEDDAKPWRGAVAMSAMSTYRVSLEREAIISTPCIWHTMEYGASADERARGVVTSDIIRAGTAHGIALWFETVLTDQVGFASAPGVCGPIYGQLFLPFPEPVAVKAGDSVEAVVRADVVDNTMMWSWAGAVRTSDGVVTTFNQSMFNPQTIDLNKLEAHESVAAVGLDQAESDCVDAGGLYVQSEDLLSCELDGETVLLSLLDNEYYALDAVGTCVWRCLAEPRNVPQLVAHVMQRFDVDSATCKEDVSALLSHLVRRRLVLPVSAAG